MWGAEPNRVLVAEAAGFPPGRALDLACGEGRNAIWLAGLGWRVTAVDFSEVAIAKARTKAAEHAVDVDFLCADLLEYEPEEGAYDLVVVLFLHIQAEQRRLVLSRAAAALAPGGTFLLVGHDSANLTDGVGGPSDPAVLCTPDDIVAEVAGLEIEKAERILRDVDGEDRPAIDALVRARRPVS
ncbi:MAG: methyltransferase [Actinobacteria bacterium RBG_16_68_12]|nr:MAG: methyltransferase [Actinobacteria bacterium RBG_16_68_12]